MSPKSHFMALDLLSKLLRALLTVINFAWACFVRPLGQSQDGQKGRLDSFYSGQAGIYDSSRRHLLQGRETMLQLSAAMLKEQQAREPGKPLVWVDVGGGAFGDFPQICSSKS